MERSIYNRYSHLGNNLVAAAKIFAGSDYVEGKEFVYLLDNGTVVHCLIDDINISIWE